MQTQVSEETLTLDAPVVEAVDAYPYPHLRESGHSRPLEFGVVALENEFLRALVCPALGGRLLAVRDKRDGRDVLSPGLRLKDGGERGAWLETGLHVSLEPTIDSMAQVDHLVHEDGAVLTYRLSCRGQLGVQVVTGLAPGTAEITVEARVFNRTLRCVSFCLDAVAGDPVFGNLHWSSGFCRIAGPYTLAPRDNVAFQIRLPVFDPHGHTLVCNDDVRVSVLDGVLRVQAAREMKSHKIVLLDERGQKLEVTTDLNPAAPFEAEAPDKVAAIALLDGSGDAVFESKVGDDVVPEPATSSLSPAEPSGHDPACEPLHLRGAAHLALLAGLLPKAARDEVDEALGTLSDDPLTWWQRAHLSCAMEEEGEGELETAHALSPLEPALRAEAFLASDGAPSLLKPLTPDAVSNVACLLIEMGCASEATRLLDAAIENTDCALLRWMLARLLLDAGLDVDAAAHVAAAKLSLPYLVHEIEVRAVRDLAARFPADESLRRMLEMIEGG
ncbi:MAG TPA: DUF5107 domain-containing protein [Fimbriimonadaceae bacterium]|nr:DUF5107 domain-containing protein [Fimbriimonadaceae bacterium]